jgi:hypothetical protein
VLYLSLRRDFVRNNVTVWKRQRRGEKKEKGKRKGRNKDSSVVLFTKVAAGRYNSQEMGLKEWGVYEQNKPVLILVAK